MSDKRKWYQTPLYNWIGTAVPLAMALLYLQRLSGPDPRASTPWVLAVWIIMFVTWLVSALIVTRRDKYYGNGC